MVLKLSDLRQERCVHVGFVNRPCLPYGATRAAYGRSGSRSGDEVQAGSLMIKPVIGRPPKLIDIAAQRIQAQPEGYLGPWFLALVGLTYMMGILTGQVIKYFSTFGYESLRLFLLVVSCIILSIVQWVVMIIAEWDWSVANYGDLRLIAWWTGMTACLGIFMFFAAIIAIDPFNRSLLHKLSIYGLSFNVATDAAITGLTLWKIVQGGKTYSPQTQQGLQRLRNITAEAAVPPTICVILNIGFYLGMSNKNLVSHWADSTGLAPVLERSFPTVFQLRFPVCGRRVAVRRTFNGSTQEDDETLSTSFQFAKHHAADHKGKQGETQKTTTTFATMPELSYPGRSFIDTGQERLGGNADIV
ncbi:hypothetical protein M407DRAFT_234454 [Tulasnella calospora MUT 4182]|uniref:Uncharacterized protein n=1 Tax=Tulasnella calospora MUT 4182 TaxID=1051891 RepID=A0A0C3QKY9_9AGAM|nr:hypothetical protein M407DRAFT_234454 [Tulasnella calospora MUT 4182]